MIGFLQNACTRNGRQHHPRGPGGCPVGSFEGTKGVLLPQQLPRSRMIDLPSSLPLEMILHETSLSNALLCPIASGRPVLGLTSTAR
jgi:hypothetical protein